MYIALLRQNGRARVMMLLGLACVGTASGQNYPQFRVLPSAFGGPITESFANCVSGDGVFIGGASWDDVGRRAYRWGGVAVTITTLIGTLPGGSGSSVRAFSHDGSVAVGSGSSFWYANEAFVSNGPESLFGLGVLDERFDNSYANGVSADGAVVVGTLQKSVPSAFSPFKWTPSAGMTELPVAGAGERWRGEAHGVSSDGRVVVGWIGTDVPPERVAARWVDDGPAQSLGEIPSGSTSKVAMATNADGSVIVGTICPLPEGSESQLFRWTVADGIELLGNLPGQGDSTETALDVSDDGEFVVGVASEQLYPETAVIWDRFNGLRRVAEVVGFNSLYHLDRATGISADGRVISGTATINTGFGRTVAWRGELWPPRCRREDIDNDRVVGLTDLATLLSNFGEEAAQYYDGDLTLDRVVSLSDLAVLLGAFGASCD